MTQTPGPKTKTPRTALNLTVEHNPAHQHGNRLHSRCETAKTTQWQRAQWAVILNLSPDSFSGDGAGQGTHGAIHDVERRLEQLKDAHLDWLDVGAVSTRPGAESIAPELEWQRLSTAWGAISAFKQKREERGAPVRISVDTSSPTVARRAAETGLVSLINDVWAGRKCEAGHTTLDVAAQYGLGIVLMHMQGNPKTMQASPLYEDCLAEVARFLAQRLEVARAAGVQNIYLDPGIGFGKTLENNLELLSFQGYAKLQDVAAAAGIPARIMIGLSRKRFLHELHKQSIMGAASDELTDPAARDTATKQWEHRCIDHASRLDKDALITELVIRSHLLPQELTDC